MRLPHRFPTLTAQVVVAIAFQTQPGLGLAQTASYQSNPRPRFWQAAAGVAAVNWITWGYDWYVQDWQWANVGLRSWAKNLREGFVWDDDLFLDNQLAHPFQGSLYHASGRGSGYGFWGSVPFVAGGSFTWELLGENIRPSLNDFITTTFGGAAIGEVTFRLGSLLRRSGTSSARPGQEFASFLVSPVGRIQGLIHSDGSGSESAEGGAENVFQIGLGQQAGRVQVQLHVGYGDAFDPGFHHPYDAFQFDVDVGPTGGPDVSRVGISGLLARKTVGWHRRDRLILGLFQHYDYRQVGLFESGGQSISGAVLYRHLLGTRSRLDLGFHAEAVLLGGISSDYQHYWHRDYDLGIGPAGRFQADFTRDGWEWIRLDGRWEWLHSLHGSDGAHITSFLKLRASLPLVAGLGVGGDAALVVRHSNYPAEPDGSQRISQLRGYLIWMP